MSAILLLLLVAIALTIYLEYFWHDPDELDRKGNPVRRKRR